MITISERIVVSGTAALAVYERGEATATRPTVVIVHGWPDCHDVWDPVADRLAADFHVVSFDARGVGASTPALVHQPYALERMAEDIDAVIAAVSPDRPVHLVGHDWGSVEGWEYVARAPVADRVQTFTSLSGPCIDHMGFAMRTALRRPTPANVAPVVAQLIKSGYTFVLSTPVVRTLLWRLGFGRVFRRWLTATEGIKPSAGYPGPNLAQDAIAAVGLYRTNIPRRILRPQIRRATVPVHLIVATRDFYVSPRPLARVVDWADDLTRHDLPAGHWSPITHAPELAALIGDYVKERNL